MDSEAEDFDGLVDEDENEGIAAPVADVETTGDEDYSAKVQKRIGKVVKQRNIARERAEELARQNAELLEMLREGHKEMAEISLKKLREEKVEAASIDDWEKVAEIDERIIEAKSSQPQPRQEQKAEELPKALTDWQVRNRWVFEPENPKTIKANKIYAELVNDGFDPEDAETFEEIDKRMVTDRPPPSQPPDRGGAVGAANSEFTAQDKAMMAEFGLDPTNKDHRIEWAKSKKAANDI